MKKNLLFTVSLFLCASIAFAQVAINSTGADPTSSAMLDVSSSTKGMRIPRMTSNERKAIPVPDMGLLVYDSDKQTIYLYDGVQWKPMMVGAENKLPLILRSPQGAYQYGSFGEAVAIYGNYAVVGAPTDSSNGSFCGAAYVFAKENGVWVQQAKIGPSNGVTGDQFGSSVDIHGDIIVIGAPEKAISGIAGRGKMYIFKRSNRTWTQVADLQASNGAANDKFGKSVSTNEQCVVVGAPYADYSGKADAGTVYVFGLINSVWSQKAILHPAITNAGDNFGFDVSVYGTTAAIGAPSALTNGAITGAAYVFNNTDLAGFTWIESQKLNPAAIITNTFFGYSVSVSGSTLLVGLPHYANAGNSNSGAVWRYVRNLGQWNYTGSMFVDENNLYTGFKVATDGTNDIFNMNGWQNNKGRVAAGSGSISRYFYDEDNDAQRVYGWSIDIHDGQIVITAHNTALWGANGFVFFGKID